MTDNSLLQNGDPGHGYQGSIGRTLKESKPWWRPEVRPRDGAPNIVMILLDDLGFSDFGCFGSEIKTPNIDALAAGGLKFTGYTTVPMCTPARAALMTGKNPHSVGCGWLTHANPGYPGFQAGEMSQDAPTVQELLRANGYATYAVGKWHNTADTNVTSSADKSAWPLQRGFDRFYGFLGAETNFFSPGQLVEGNEFLRNEEYPQGYYSSNDWTDRAIGYLRAHQGTTRGRPFYLYVAHNAPHVPLQATPEDIAGYDGVYSQGWEAVRQARFARQKLMGLIPESWRMSGASPGVPNWDDVPEADRPVMAHYMQIYAAMVSNIDMNIGRLVAELKSLGIFDDTLILLTSDNGASSIGGPDGAANIFEKRVTQKEAAGLPKAMFDAGKLGDVDSYPAYPVGWANCSNTPFRFYKRTPMNGGIRVPFVASYPALVRDPGSARSQWIHVTDTLPTLLEVAGIAYPAQFKGYKTRPLDGASYAGLFTQPGQPAQRSSQYYELEGNRGFIQWPWKICSLQPPGTAINLDNWLLFNIEQDPTECDNLAASQPDQLRALVQEFEVVARANYAYPLDNRDNRRVLAVPPFMQASYARPHRFYPGHETISPIVVSPLIADRNFHLSCQFTWKRGDEGVLFALGDSGSGLAAFVLDGKVHVSYSAGAAHKHEITLPLSEGEQTLDLAHLALGQRQGRARVSVSNRQGDAELNMSPTILRLGGEGLDIGLDRKRKVSATYMGKGSFPYSGDLKHVHVMPGKQAADSLTNRPEAMAQLD